MRDKKITCKEKIHTVLCIAGVMSRKAIGMMDKQDNYKRKVLYQLRQSHLIERRKKEYLITKAGMCNQLWRDRVPEEYVSMSKKIRGNFMRATEGEAHRYLNQSEILTAMLDAEVTLWERDVFPGRDVEDDLYIRAIRVKRMCLEDRKTVNRSKALGTLFVSKKNLYNIYGELGKSVQCGFLSELRYKEFTEAKYMENEGKIFQAEAVLFVNELLNFDCLIGENIGQGGFETIASIYEKVYVFPKSRAGSKLFSMMLHPDFKNVTEKIAADQGAADFLLPELRTLRRYYCTGEKRICCMVEYVQMVKRVFPEAEVIGITIEELVEELQVL